MSEIDFDTAFRELTGHGPFPWQRALYGSFVRDDIPPACNLPTGLGKTSVIAVWLIALATHPEKMPRRLVYVVNRRTVVDQTTEEVEKYLKREVPGIPAFAVSTLRGQFADNREWSADPSRPAVISGTVDMIGSRLLFSGYGVGMKGRPLHAGFLAQDVLLVHDEAHLEPAFQDLIRAIEDEQKRCKEFRKFRVMELTATPRGDGKVFELTEREKNPDGPIPDEPQEPIHHVWRRTHASKALELYPVADEKKTLVPTIAELALGYKDSEAKPAVLIFVRTVQSVEEVVTALKKGKVDPDGIETLTGTMRGLERERMATESAVFARFRKGLLAEPRKGTVYLVCTSAGEVGVDMSADHLICDLSTYESMAQRFGRVNRYGNGAARIDVVHPAVFDTQGKPLEAARARTVGLLGKLRCRPDGLRDASPAGLSELLERAIHEGSGGDTTDRTKALREYILAAFAPAPAVLPVTDILFDAWALTTVRGKLPGRPEVEPYLHGEAEEDQATYFAWREEVSLLTGCVADSAIAELMGDFPLKPHETLRVPTFGKRGSAAVHLEAIAERKPAVPVWVLEPSGEVTVFKTLAELSSQVAQKRRSLAGRTVILPPAAGGLTKNGMLDGNERRTDGRDYDVAGIPPKKAEPLLRLKLVGGDGEAAFVPVAKTAGWDDDRSDDSLPARLKAVVRLDLRGESEEDEAADGVVEYLVVRTVKPRTEKAAAEWPGLTKHLAGVRGAAEQIVSRLNLDSKLAEAVVLAAAWHDLGKLRAVWQHGAGNLSGYVPVAKTLHGRPPENLNHYRHELGSMVDLMTVDEYAAKLDALDQDQREVVLHLIATHHGRGRPHFPEDESHDGERPTEAVAGVVSDAPGRFARLQRKYGRWGLAYLESLLRAADIVESRRIEAAPLPDDRPKEPPTAKPRIRPLAPRALPPAAITVAVDPTNPGQFFACCGLLELADRLWPGAEGWFTERKFCIACGGSLSELLQRLSAATVSSSLTDAELKRLGTLQSMDKRKRTPEIAAEMNDLRTRWRLERLHLSEPFDLWLDWWRDNTGERTDLKTWAAKVQVLGMAREFHQLIKSLRRDTSALTECLTQSVRADALPFYFDSDAGAQGSALDAGFSAYDLRTVIRGHSPKRPLIELGSFIAFQRFRPCPVAGTDRYRFSTWAAPLPVSAAGVVAVAAVEVTGTQRYEFRLFSRTQYMKTFLPATPLGGTQ